MESVVTATTTPTATPPPAQTIEEAVSNVSAKVGGKTKTKHAKAVSNDTTIPETKEKPKYKLAKIDGTEYEVDEKAYHDAARKALTADKRMHEATTLQKKLLEDQRLLEKEREKISAQQKKTPVEIFKEMQARLDDPTISKAFRAEIEQWLLSQIEYDEASPEVKRASALEKENATLKAKEKAREDEKNNTAREAEKSEHRRTAQESIMGVLKASGLPPTEFLVKKIADIKFNARKAKVNVTDEQVANFLKTDTLDTSSALYGSFAENIIKAKAAGDSGAILKAGEALISHLPENIIKALRVYDYTKHVSGVPRGANPIVDTPKAPPQKESGAYEFNKFDDYQENRRKFAQDLQKSWKKV